VLVVEKDDESRARASEILTQHGYVVQTSNSASQAVAALEKDPDGVQLVFSNLSLPDQSGIRLADEIRTRFPKMPVLVTGSFSHEAAELTSIPKKGYSYLQKPYQAEDLLEAIRRCLASAEPSP
jgi:DNA-binding NtrC family response regulator